MKLLKSILIFSLSMLSINTYAAFHERLGGLAYYDDVANLTWLSDANYGVTSGQFNSWGGSLVASKNWAASLEIGGITGWRLPNNYSDGIDCIYSLENCAQGELYNLFYNALGGVEGTPIDVHHNDDYSLFSNVMSGIAGYNYGIFWYSYYNPAGIGAYAFDFNTGGMIGVDRANQFQAWLVRTGDVSSVPVPSAIWLFISGFIAIGLRSGRRKNLL